MLERLIHAVLVDVSKRIEVSETVYRSAGSSPAVPVEVFKGYLEPRTLRKLKYKTIFSLREDFKKEGRLEEADEIINFEL